MSLVTTAMPAEFLATATVQALETLLWSETISLPEDPSEIPATFPQELRESDGDAFDAHFCIGDIPVTARMELADELKDFCGSQWDVISRLGLDPGQVGHDFILTRNGHGAGFWDRGHGRDGDTLTAECKEYGSLGLSLSDDGTIFTHS